MTKSVELPQVIIFCCRHCSNLFTSLPAFVSDQLIPDLESGEQSSAVTRSFQGHDVSSIVEILRYLEVVLEDSTVASQKDRVLPIVTTLTSLSRSSRVIRKYCRLRVGFYSSFCFLCLYTKSSSI